MLLNGAPVDAERLKPLALTNYGHFTSMVVADGRVRGLTLHLDRLAGDCRAVFGAELDRDAVRRQIRASVPDGAGPTVVRVTVYDPQLDLGHPAADAMPQLLVTTRGITVEPLPPLALQPVVYQRELPQVKHTGLFATLYHRRQAQLQGFDDVLFADVDGFVSEGATWNIGFVRDGRVVWPDRPCLPGITMELLKRVCPSDSAGVGVADPALWSGAFVTNAAIGVRAVKRIGDHVWEEADPLVASLQARYAAIAGEPL